MAQVDYFLKIDDLQGESRDSKYAGAIELIDWSWGETNQGSASFGSGSGSGKVYMQDFNFTMTTSKVSPKLLLHCANGKHFNKATLICRKAGETQHEYLTITFENVFISSYQTGGSGGAGILPVDHISFNYSKMLYEYKEQKDTGQMGGAVIAGWDLKENKQISSVA